VTGNPRAPEQADQVKIMDLARALGNIRRKRTACRRQLAQRTVDGPLRKARATLFRRQASILMVLVGLALTFELLGWILVRQSFLLNEQRLVVMILQVSVIGIIAVGRDSGDHQPAAIDLSSGSVGRL